jgi:diacylglycerol kinase family enzyme
MRNGTLWIGNSFGAGLDWAAAADTDTGLLDIYWVVGVSNAGVSSMVCRIIDP